MKKRGVILLLLFSVILLSLKLVCADENLFSGYIYTMDTFEVEDDLYYITIANGQDVMILHKNEFDVYFIYNNSCDETPYYRYCYNGSKLDYEEYGRQIPNSFSWEPAYHLEIFSKSPEITVERVLENTEINRDQHAFVEVTIENNGNLDLTDLVLTEKIPDSATLLSYNGFTKYGDTLKVTRSVLYPGQTMVMSYLLDPNSYDDIKLENGTINYTYEAFDYGESIGTDTITINSPYTVSASIDDTSPGIGEEFEYTITVSNDDWNDNLEFDFTLVVPKNVQIVKKDYHLTKDGNTISHDFDVPVGEEKSYSVTMKSMYDSVYQLSETWHAAIRDEEYSEQETYKVNVSIPKLDIDMTTSQDDIFEGSPFTIYVDLENPGEVAFYNLTATVECPELFDTRNINIGYIAPGDEKTIFEEQINGLSVLQDVIYNISLNGQYRTSSMQFFSFDDEASVKVKPVTVGFDISKTVDKTSVYPGETVKVTLKVKNIGQKIAVIDLKDTIPPPFQLISGLTEKTITLGINEEEELYIYKVKLPPDAPVGTYSFETFMDYEGVMNQTKTVNITVKQNESQAAEFGSETNLDINYEPEEKKKKGFFSAILDFFIGIFS